jgi:hypothetical protein
MANDITWARAVGELDDTIVDRVTTAGQARRLRLLPDWNVLNALLG